MARRQPAHCPSREDFLPYCDPCTAALCGDVILPDCPSFNADHPDCQRPARQPVDPHARTEAIRAGYAAQESWEAQGGPGIAPDGWTPDCVLLWEYQARALPSGYAVVGEVVAEDGEHFALIACPAEEGECFDVDTGDPVWCGGVPAGTCINNRGCIPVPVDCETGEMLMGIGQRGRGGGGGRGGRGRGGGGGRGGRGRGGRGRGRGGRGRGWGWKGKARGGRPYWFYGGPYYGNWWNWWAFGYPWWYGAYPDYSPTYQSCCVDPETGTLFCGGYSYPGQILRVQGQYAEVAHGGGVGWYPLCGA